MGAGNAVVRVVRGGSWVSGRDFARCAYRIRFFPTTGITTSVFGWCWGLPLFASSDL